MSADGADELLEALRAMPMPMPARDGLYGPEVQLLDMRGNRVPEAHELADDPRVNLAFQRPQLAQR